MIKDVTPHQLLDWIHGIHKRIARVLMDDDKAIAGEYSTSSVIRWRYGFTFRDRVTSHVVEIHNAYSLEQIAHDAKVDLAELEQFANIMKKWYNNHVVKGSFSRNLKSNNHLFKYCRNLLPRNCGYFTCYFYVEVLGK
jgi:hypothetical protein